MKNKQNEQKNNIVSKFLRSAVGSSISLVSSAIISIVLPLVMNLVWGDGLGSAKAWWSIVACVLGYLLLVAICCIVVAVCNAKGSSKDTYDDVAAELSAKISELEQNKIALSSVTTDVRSDIEGMRQILRDLMKKDLLDQIYDGQGVAKLEASVGAYEEHPNHLDIFILASSFTLELAKGEGALRDPIVWNLRKGVKYHYLIPHGNSYRKKYVNMLQDWYKRFSFFLSSKSAFEEFEKKYIQDEENIYGRFWSHDYLKLVDDARAYWNNNEGNIENLFVRAKGIFQELIVTHVEETSLFFVTAAAYENQDGGWDAIIKIPTENPNIKYYALRVSPNQIEHFMRQFSDLYKDTIYTEKDGVPHNFGGKLSLDFNEICQKGA